MSTKFSALVFASAIAIGCGGTGATIHPIDLGGGGTGGTGGGGTGGSGGGGTGGSGGGGTGGTGGSGGGGADMAMKTYLPSSIAQMRMQGQYGGFELDNVVVLIANYSGTSMYVQDSAGGDFSAIAVACPASTCAAFQSTVKTAATNDAVTLKGTFVKVSAAKGGTETFYLEGITDSGASKTIPAVGTVTYAQAVKGASTPAKWFQKVNVTLTDDLAMFDYTPTELAYVGGTKCTYQDGWGMVPKTGAPVLTMAEECCANPSTTACTTQATAQTAMSANELLIGTDFFVGFTMSSDCRCSAGTHPKTVPTATQIIPMAKTLSGILIYNTIFKTTTAFQYLAPITNADFPIQ